MDPEEIMEWVNDNMSESSSESSNEDGFLSTSSDESLFSEDMTDDEDEDAALFPIIQLLLHGRPRQRVRQFLETANSKSDSEFREDFRLKREVANELIGQLAASGYIPNHEGGKEKKSAEIVRRVLAWLVSLMPTVVVWPQGNEAVRVSQAFQEKADIAGCIGAIDGSHIPIQKPVHNGRFYFSRKQHYTILLQAVVDCDMKFTNLYCGDPGSFHDLRMLRRSDLYHYTEQDVERMFPNNLFLLGDKGYYGVATRWIVTPFKDYGDLTREQSDFNTRVSATRVVVEQAFGVLKSRFRRLKKTMELRDIPFIINVILGCCVLHNICQNNGDVGYDLLVDDNVDEDSDGSEDEEEREEADCQLQGIGIIRTVALFNEMYPGNNVQYNRCARAQ